MDKMIARRPVSMAVLALMLAACGGGDVSAMLAGTLFATFPTPATPTTPLTTTATGQKFASVLQIITGGPRPLFVQGLLFGGSFGSTWGALGGDGTISGALNQSILGTTAFSDTIDDDAAGSTALRAAALQLTAVPDANRLRRDGLRRIPQINGDFSVVEQVEAFAALVTWEQGGAKPAGDDVVTAATVAAPTHGCTFTRDTLGRDGGGSTHIFRGRIAACTPACPAP